MNRAARGMIIFDLDGTLTVPMLDFDAIRAEIGLPSGPILEAVADMPETARQRALAILDSHEQVAAREAMLHEGAAETLDEIRERGWPIAILTRNSRRRAEEVVARFGLRIDALGTRDDGVIKPSPAPIRTLCRTTGAEPTASWMVGDHLMDLQSGSSAGCTTVLMLGDRKQPAYANQADHVITQLRQIPHLLASAMPPRAT